MHTAPQTATELRAGELRLALRSDLGGCLAGLWLGELPVLLSSEPGALQSVRPCASYPLLPYSNRIGGCRFQWRGRNCTTLPNFGSSPHSLHGVGWQRPWRIVAHEGTSVRLVLEHGPDAHWPFAFEAEQRIDLSPQGLRLGLRLTNTDSRPAPAGLGWHPYFPKRRHSRLHAELTGRWERDDETELPTQRITYPGIDADIEQLDFDHCFDGWRGTARLRDDMLSLRLDSSLSCLVVYTPPNKPYFCVEPVSHVSNALQMADPLAHGVRELAPGNSCDAWMELHVARS